MLKQFKEYLLQKGKVKANQIPYYLKWIGNCYAFLNVSDSILLTSDQKKQFLSHMAKNHEDWQINQADYAIRLYNFFLSKQRKEPSSGTGFEDEWKTIEDNTRKALHLRHRSLSTEKLHIIWLRQFHGFAGTKDPKTICHKEYSGCKESSG